jgi:hypothetical protein
VAGGCRLAITGRRHPFSIFAAGQQTVHDRQPSDVCERGSTNKLTACAVVASDANADCGRWDRDGK